MTKDEALRLALDALTTTKTGLTKIAAASRGLWEVGDDVAAADTAIEACERALSAPAAPKPAPAAQAEPAARYPHPDEDDAVTLWAEIHRLRAANHALAQENHDLRSRLAQIERALAGLTPAHPPGG